MDTQILKFISSWPDTPVLPEILLIIHDIVTSELLDHELTLHEPRRKVYLSFASMDFKWQEKYSEATFKRPVGFELRLPPGWQQKSIQGNAIALILRKFHDTFRDQILSELFDHLDWLDISKYQILSEQFIHDFSDKLDWNVISEYQVLPETLMGDFANHLNWDAISRYQKLSEPFMRRFSDRLEWKNISRYQKLSEQFIRDFAGRIHWPWISRYQELSERIIWENSTNIDLDSVVEYQKHLPQNTLKRLKILSETLKLVAIEE